MSPANDFSRKWIFSPLLSLLLTVFSWGVQVMAKDVVLQSVGSFYLSWSGSWMYQYGSKRTSFDGKGKFRYETGDTLNSEDETGVGVFELGIQNSELAEINIISDILCSDAVGTGGFSGGEGEPAYGVVCLHDGKVVKKTGSQGMIPEKQKAQIFGVINRLERQAIEHGIKVAKLDFKTDKVEYKDGNFIVSISFINSGDSKITFKTPDQWDGTDAGQRLGVGSSVRVEKGGEKTKLDKGWSFTLGGQTLVNRNEFSDGVIALKPRSSATLRFKSSPKNSVSKGNYEFTGIAFMTIECDCDSGPLGDKLYFSPIKTRITIDRDYPSTPKEREEWEARHRAAMLPWPVKPGEAFPEDGLYRAVRVGTGTRSLQLQPFKTGDIATTDSVRLLTDAATGSYLDGAVQWVWESSPPVRSSQPFTMVEGTEQVCKPGAVCSRSGRWLARLRTSDWKYHYDYDLSQIVTVQQGKTMPAIRNDSRADWEWIGV